MALLNWVLHQLHGNGRWGLMTTPPGTRLLIPGEKLQSWDLKKDGEQWIPILGIQRHGLTVIVSKEQLGQFARPVRCTKAPVPRQ
jgi:hypothetical protein